MLRFLLSALHFSIAYNGYYFKCWLMVVFYEILSFSLHIVSLLREYNNKALLEREFGGSALIAVEIANYFKQSTNQDWQCLEKFPIIKKLYLKYNCIPCNEADVERIFSFAGIPSCVTVKVKGILAFG